MRGRYTRAEFWRSKRIASLSWEDRLVLKAVEGYVDDNGVGRDEPEMIAADAFPRDLVSDPCGTLRKISEGLRRLRQQSFVIRYEKNGESLLAVAWWEEIQPISHPLKGALPRPDGSMNYDRKSPIRPEPELASENFGRLPQSSEDCRKFPPSVVTISSHYQQSQENKLAQSVDELTNAQTLDDTASPDTDTDPSPATIPTPAAASGSREITSKTDQGFETFWDTYPRRRDKKRAHTAFRKALKRANLETIIDGARRCRDDPNRDDQYTKYPEGWLNADGWHDEPLPNRTNGTHIDKPALKAIGWRNAADQLIAEMSDDQ